MITGGPWAGKEGGGSLVLPLAYCSDEPPPRNEDRNPLGGCFFFLDPPLSRLALIRKQEGLQVDLRPLEDVREREARDLAGKVEGRLDLQKSAPYAS